MQSYMECRQKFKCDRQTHIKLPRAPVGSKQFLTFLVYIWTESAESWPEHNGSHQSTGPAPQVNNSGASKIVKSAERKGLIGDGFSADLDDLRVIKPA